MRSLTMSSQRHPSSVDSSQGRNLRMGKVCPSLTLPPLPLFFPFPLAPLNQVGHLGVRCKEHRQLANLVHYEAARKPLVEITLNILSTMFYVFEEIHWRWCRNNTVPLSHTRSAVNDGVSPSPKVGGGRSRLGPPLNPPLIPCS